MRRMAFVTVLCVSPSAAAPFNVQFGADGRYVYFRWRQPGTDTLDQDYRVSVAPPQRIELGGSQAGPLCVHGLVRPRTQSHELL